MLLTMLFAWCCAPSLLLVDIDEDERQAVAQARFILRKTIDSFPNHEISWTRVPESVPESAWNVNATTRSDHLVRIGQFGRMLSMPGTTLIEGKKTENKEAFFAGWNQSTGKPAAISLSYFHRAILQDQAYDVESMVQRILAPDKLQQGDRFTTLAALPVSPYSIDPMVNAGFFVTRIEFDRKKEAVLSLATGHVLELNPASSPKDWRIAKIREFGDHKPVNSVGVPHRIVFREINQGKASTEGCFLIKTMKPIRTNDGDPRQLVVGSEPAQPFESYAQQGAILTRSNQPEIIKRKLGIVEKTKDAPTNAPNKKQSASYAQAKFTEEALESPPPPITPIKRTVEPQNASPQRVSAEPNTWFIPGLAGVGLGALLTLLAQRASRPEKPTLKDDQVWS